MKKGLTFALLFCITSAGAFASDMDAEGTSDSGVPPTSREVVEVLSQPAAPSAAKSSYCLYSAEEIEAVRRFVGFGHPMEQVNAILKAKASFTVGANHFENKVRDLAKADDIVCQAFYTELTTASNRAVVSSSELFTEDSKRDESHFTFTVTGHKTDVTVHPGWLAIIKAIPEEIFARETACLPSLAGTPMSFKDVIEAYEDATSDRCLAWFNSAVAEIKEKQQRLIEEGSTRARDFIASAEALFAPAAASAA